MRILVVTNLYPPQHIGGYELGCQDVVEALRGRGHVVSVLTSTFQLKRESAAGVECEVDRTLHLVTDSSGARHRKLLECRLLVRALRRHRPEIVYFWNQGGLLPWLPMITRWLGYRVAFFLSDTNFVSWRVGAFLLRWAPATAISRLACLLRTVFGETFLLRGWPVVQSQACQFASLFLRCYAERAGISVADEFSAVVRWGIDLRRFPSKSQSSWPRTRLLYVGQLIPQKGVHTAIAALGLLSETPEFSTLTLTVVGGGMHPEYEKGLREQVVRAELEDRVSFLGKIPRADLPRIYAEHDILLFPSEWDEPFAITPLEAMCCGLAIVGTTTGGSGELLRNQDTAITFAAGDSGDCARAIRELCCDQQLFVRIRSNGEREVKKHHMLETMVATIEAKLVSVVRR